MEVRLPDRFRVAEGKEAMSKRIRRVEKDPEGGWIARNRNGSEILKDFRWNSRSAAQGAVTETDLLSGRRSESKG